MTDVNLSNIQTIYWGQTPVSVLVVNDVITWMKDANGAFYVGQTVYQNGTSARVISKIENGNLFSASSTVGFTTNGVTTTRVNTTPYNMFNSLGYLNVDNADRSAQQAPKWSSSSSFDIESYGWRRVYMTEAVGTLLTFTGDENDFTNSSWQTRNEYWKRASGPNYPIASLSQNFSDFETLDASTGVKTKITWQYDTAKTSAQNYTDYGVNSVWHHNPYFAWHMTPSGNPNSPANLWKVTTLENGQWVSNSARVFTLNKGTSSRLAGVTGSSLGGATNPLEIMHTSDEHPHGQFIGGPMKWVGTKAGHTSDMKAFTGSNFENSGYDNNIWVTAMDQSSITGRNAAGLTFTCTWNGSSWVYA